MNRLAGPGSPPKNCGCIYRCPDRDRAERHLLRWFVDVAEHEIPELVRLARTLDAWRDELLAYFNTGGVSNGPTEAINGLIKKVKRVGAATATSTTTDSAYFCTAAPTGTLPPHPDQRTATTLGCVEPLKNEPGSEATEAS
jgi:hypothetical protein